jgi:hypothetical protein
MTAVSLVRVDFTEIESVQVQCSNCKTEVSLPMSREIPNRLDCPGCHAVLWVTGAGAIFAQALADAVRRWRSLEQKRCSLSFTVPVKQLQLPQVSDRKSD